MTERRDTRARCVDCVIMCVDVCVCVGVCVLCVCEGVCVGECVRGLVCASRESIPAQLKTS